nr:unnamed protein product [Digitaria exilis]
MAEGSSRRRSAFSPGLAVLLSGDEAKISPQKTHLVSYHDEIGHQAVERTIEHILDLPHKSVVRPPGQIDAAFVHSVLRNQARKFDLDWDKFIHGYHGSVLIVDKGAGQSKVVLDDSSVCGKFRSVRGPLLVESSGPFSSARANACVWKGKWMYEVTLETSGVQQLGWATLSCPFTDQRGVGDADDSYSFDGRRVTKWNNDPKPYGQPWTVGDVIGCCIDLDAGEISFYRNGASLGVAFDRIRNAESRKGYYPAISLSEGERCHLNFGSHPFRLRRCIVSFAAWYRATLFSPWKQRGMYATCMWVVELLLVLSDSKTIFQYVPEFYVESLVDCFHALRRSDPPFVSPAVFLKQGLASFVCSGFASTKNGEPSSSATFQVLLRETCIHEQELFLSFLNRLFNTLSWTMTEFSMSIREMQDKHQVADLQQRKCSVIFDISCNLARILEFCTREIPCAFLMGPDMNLRRLTELVVFILNHIISAANAEFFDISTSEHRELNDVIAVFASMDCPATIHFGLQYLLSYNWSNVLRGDASLAKLAQLEEFSHYFRRITMAVDDEEDRSKKMGDEEEDDTCCICYNCDSDATFQPCHHRSCFGCISRHLLNSQRCFFCNAVVTSITRIADS